MSSTVFSKPSDPVPEVSAGIPEPFEPAKDSLYESYDNEPVEASEADSVVLGALGIDDMVQNLSGEDQGNLAEVTKYITDIATGKGLSLTETSFAPVLDSLKAEMGLDPNAGPETVLDRIGGVVKAWKSISFIKDAKEKRSLFMKLAKLDDSKAMNKMVFDEMESREVWN